MDWTYYLSAVLAFLAVVMLIEGIYLVWNAYSGPEARLIERRLQSMSSAGDTVDAKLLKERLLSGIPAFERLLLKLPRIQELDHFIQQSGLGITVATFLGVSIALWVVAAVVAIAAGLPRSWSAGLGLVPLLAWIAFVQYRRARRMHLIDQQLPDALDLMARAMQAGHAFSSALRMVGTEGPHPIADEFQMTFDEINFGISTQQALTNLSTRVASPDLRYFVVAVVIQRETGGNLAELLTGIASLIRERQRLMGTVRVLSAEGRLSAWILSILPFAVAGVMTMINPEFIKQLWTDPIGIKLVTGALILMVTGIFWMWRTIKIRI